MEDLKKKMSADMNDKEIVFSKSIKAGKRIYYLDVKKNRKDEMFLAITESKKVITGEGDDSQVSFEKHKIFLYREDFQKFMAGLTEAISFIDRSEMGDYNSQLDQEADEENEQALLYKEIEKQYQKFSKKYDGYELKQHLTQSLFRKGYDFDAIASALREYF